MNWTMIEVETRPSKWLRRWWRLRAWFEKKVCEHKGHRWYSECDPENGWERHCCLRCGEVFESWF